MNLNKRATRRARALTKAENRRPLVRCDRCGKHTRGLRQHQENGCRGKL